VSNAATPLLLHARTGALSPWKANLTNALKLKSKL